MNLYIWVDVSGITKNYHGGGSVLIVASSVKDALEMWKNYKDKPSQKGLGENCIEGRLPDYAYELKKRPKKEVFVFPDAGCC